MNPRQAKFVAEYLKDPNATQAAIRAGYSKRTARSQGGRLLTNVAIRDELLSHLRERSKQTGIDAAWVLQRLGELAGVKIGELFDEKLDLRPLKDLPDAADRLIASVKFDDRPGHARRVSELKLQDRLKVLELIGKHVTVAAFSENVRHDLGDDLMELMEDARRRATKR